MGNCQKQENQQEALSLGSGPVNSIRILNYIWNKDYQGLFDYDSKSIEKRVLKIKGDAIVIRHGTKIQLADDKISDLNQEQVKNALFRLVCKPNFYEIHPIYVEGQSFTLQKILWLVIASLPNKTHTLQQRDIIKLGKQKIKVRQIVLPDMTTSQVPTNIKLSKIVYQDLAYKNVQKSQLCIPKQQKESHSQITNSEQVCRICLEPGQYDNPLITPCKCSGSVKYIHLNCLKAWLAKRLSTSKSQFCITINWLPLSCEMCKAAFKYRIYMDNKKFYTVDIPKPPKPYIVLQLIRKQTATKGKIFHFVSFAQKKKLNMGRKKDVDVKVSDDISISRLHASIQYKQQQNKFVLSDNKSKFGTLILVKRGLIVRPKHPGVSVQLGAQVFSFDPKRAETKQAFEIQDGDSQEYFVQDQLQDKDESQQQSQESDDIDNHQIIEGQIDESSSPQLRPRVSVQSQPN